MAFAGAILIIVGLIPETYAPVILKRRAKKLRKDTGNPNIITEQEKVKLSLRDIVRTSLIRPITMILTELVLDLMSMYIVLIYSMLYAFSSLIRLLGALLGAPFIPISLFILGATSFKHIIWVGPSSSGIAFGFGMVLCYYSVNNYIIDSYQEFAASALAAKMYDRLGLQWASWLLAFLGVGMTFIPYVFYFFGARLRAKLSRD
ncbi:MFS multidrug transporter [Penicillium maclennaniae]|uniref:MFS multidrug transporter n=1 Tax=Penicillium maclennaniae TaxID=1343394 RepID=UPI0025425A06|nr:MFS multidrug transporter [Penicillium maclennaniae]KAJ5674716.1 MFS multidrug transporter [Penicillium maclennaniae]